MLAVQVITFGLLVFLSALKEIKSNCNYFQDLEIGRTYYVYNSEYPNYYSVANHCIWATKSPYVTTVNCTLEMPKNCYQDSISVQFSGSDTYKYCGYTTFLRQGIDAVITFDSSKYSGGGRFLCQVQANPIENNCRCGWKKMMSTLIVGGIETGINEYPMMAGLVNFNTKMIYCGATIISEQYVLTAAHCVYPKNPDGVVVGEHDVTTGRETSATKLYRVVGCVIHPNYVPSFYNDIAVCKIAGVITYSAQVGPVCLPFRPINVPAVTALGWGLKGFGERKSNTLQKVNLNITSNERCKFGSPGIICTDSTGGKDACQMDSGGPLLWQNPKTSNMVLVGIISGGLGCATGEPSINTRVESYVDWIKYVTPDTTYCSKE